MGGDNLLFLLLILAWLVVCAVQDWRNRQVSHWLTLPPMLVIVCLRLAGCVHEPLLPIMAILVLLLYGWRMGWIGGSDVKVSLAIGVLSLRFLIWAWLGLTLWHLGLRLYYGHKCDQRLPAFLGFAAGVGSLLVINLLK